ncbi:hypothetical protein [Paraconexibacter sp. AEG42_29]|uniref:zinc ribbon-containing protein n=1 Tax=Paraconexibacter sp. AEG42_29 TaxID=2997339 RepID=UPI00339D552C
MGELVVVVGEQASPGLYSCTRCWDQLRLVAAAPLHACRECEHEQFKLLVPARAGDPLPAGASG